jgi:NTE family protein
LEADVEEHRADGVFQGGGVKGIALAGALEEFAHNQKYPVSDWVQLAGTSAGAIVAAYLACGHGPDDTAKLIKETDFKQFRDWGRSGPVIGGGINLIRNHGLCHGSVFEDWFDAKIGGETFAGIAAGHRTLKMIASDITRREMLVLPEDLAGYSLTPKGPLIDPASFPVARAVRMSMSIPYFFQPVKLYHPTAGACTIVDGGILANFPVFIFDAETKPKRPTFGFKLYSERQQGPRLERFIRRACWPLGEGIDIFHTTTDAWDERAASHSTVVRTIPISARQVGTTQFSIEPKQRDELLASGRDAAAKFLDGWDPGEYINGHGQGLR